MRVLMRVLMLSQLALLLLLGTASAAVLPSKQPLYVLESASGDLGGDAAAGDNLEAQKPRVAFVVVGPTRSMRSASFATKLKLMIDTIGPSSSVTSDVFVYVQLRDSRADHDRLYTTKHGDPMEQIMRILNPVSIGNHDQLLGPDGNERNHSTPICPTPFVMPDVHGVRPLVHNYQLCAPEWPAPGSFTMGDFFFEQFTKLEQVRVGIPTCSFSLSSNSSTLPFQLLPFCLSVTYTSRSV